MLWSLWRCGRTARGETASDCRPAIELASVAEMVPLSIVRCLESPPFPIHLANQADSLLTLAEFWWTDWISCCQDRGFLFSRRWQIHWFKGSCTSAGDPNLWWKALMGESIKINWSSHSKNSEADLRDFNSVNLCGQQSHRILDGRWQTLDRKIVYDVPVPLVDGIILSVLSEIDSLSPPNQSSCRCFVDD
jgi:hypothetical protein